MTPGHSHLPHMDDHGGSQGSTGAASDSDEHELGQHGFASTDDDFKDEWRDVEPGETRSKQLLDVPEGVERHEKGRRRRINGWCCVGVGLLAVAILGVVGFFGVYLHQIHHLKPPDIKVVNCEAPLPPITAGPLNVNVTVDVKSKSYVSRPTTIDVVKVKVFYPSHADGIYIGTVQIHNVIVPARGQVVAPGVLYLYDVLSYPRGLGNQLISERFLGNTTHLELHGAARAYSRYGPINIPYKITTVCEFANDWKTEQRHTQCHTKLRPWWAHVDVK